MEQQKRAAGHHTGKPSKQSNSLPRSLASIDDLKQAVLNAARIEDHAERAGFRRGRGGRWHCGVHQDRNPSCTIRHGRIRCWVCGEAWNAIDLEMIATGEPFLRSLRALASEFGLAPDTMLRVSPQDAHNSRERLQEACSWREGFLEVLDGVLVNEKAKLFDTMSGPADERCIGSLTRLEQLLRGLPGSRSLTAAFGAFERILPGLTAMLVVYGDEIRNQREVFGFWLIDRLSKMEDRW